MNERILELALEAGLTGYFAADHPELATPIPISYEKQKFAELIIKECAILADQYNFEKNAGTINPFKVTAYEFIKEHFGVK